MQNKSLVRRTQVLVAPLTWLILLCSLNGLARAQGLAAAYSFNEGSGTTVGDSSANANIGTVANASWTSSGKFGGALSFNGTNSLVTVADSTSLDLTSAMTLEAWVYPTALNDWRTILMKESSGTHVYLLYANDDAPRPAAYFRTGSVEKGAQGTTILPRNAWSHVAATYDGTTFRLFVNGVQVASAAATGLINTSNLPLRIGGSTVWGEYFSGRIDEVRIYNRALSAAEVATDMNAPIGGSSSDTQSPTAPTGFSATAASSSQVNLSWTAATDNVAVSGYLVERCDGAGCSSFAQVASPTGTSYVDTNLSASISYTYRVRAVDAANNFSAYSSTASATTQAGSGSDGLAAAYSFNENTGTSAGDNSGNGNGGTLSGATWTASGKFGSALSFNGTSNIVNVADSSTLDLTSAMTLEAWVYPTALASWRTVLFKENASTHVYVLYANKNVAVPATYALIDGDMYTVPGSSALPLNTWSHLASTYDGSALRVYVNGTQVASGTVTGSIEASTGSLRIGGNSIWSEYFSGRIDEVRIYNRALSAAQITSDMNAAIGGAADTQAPSVPGSFTSTAVSSSQINLSWAASTDNVAVTGYRLERCSGAGCSNFSPLANPTGTSYNDTGLSAATSYSYRVRAQDAVPNFSAYSATASATTLSGSDSQAPTTPTNLSATPVSNTQIDLTWTASTDNIGVTNYLVERCQGPGCSNFAQIATPATPSYSDTGRSPSTSYSYRVRAQDAVPNYSAYSATASATTPATSDTQPPTAPSGLTVTAGANQNLLGWTASTDNVGVTAYLIERCQGASCSSFGQIGTSGIAMYIDSTAVAGTSYSYRVRARDAVPNYSGYSNIGTATPADCD